MDMKDNRKHLNELIDTISMMKDKDELRDFLFGILSSKEIDEIPNRLQIIKMLKRGVPHQKIAKRLKVGVATVTRGSKEIQKGRFDYIK